MTEDDANTAYETVRQALMPGDALNFISNVPLYHLEAVIKQARSEGAAAFLENPPMIDQPLYLTVSGARNAGKSTLLNDLRVLLETSGHEVDTTRLSRGSVQTTEGVSQSRRIVLIEGGL